MRAVVAKRLRRQVYGKGHHPGPVRHFIGDPKAMGLPKNLRGCHVADPSRRHYQILKHSFYLNRKQKTENRKPKTIFLRKGTMNP